MAYDPENNPYTPGDPASYDLKWIVDRLNEHAFAEESAAEAKASAEAAAAGASEASGYADDAEGYRDAASGFANDAEGYRDAASGFADDAQDAADSVQPQIDDQNNRITVLEARMDTFASLPPGSTSGNAELLDIRVGADGTTWPSAGDAVRGQVDDLKSALFDETLQNEEVVDISSLSWTDGKYINDTNGNAVSLSGYSYAVISLGDKCTKVAGYTNTAPNSVIGVAFTDENDSYISGDHSTNTGRYDYNYDLNVPQNARYFKVSCRTDYKSTLTCTKTVVFGGVFSTLENHSASINECADDVDNIENTLVDVFTDGFQHYPKTILANGGVTSGEFVPGAKYRVSTPNIVTAERDYIITAKTGYRFGVHSFQNGVFVSDSGWKTSYSITKGDTYKIVISKLSEMTTDIADIDVFRDNICLSTSISEIIPGVEEIVGTGNATYYGDLISINFEEKEKKYTNTLWKDFKGSDIQNLSSYKLNLCQSIAFYNGYVFCMCADGTFTVLDYSTKSIVSYGTYTPAEHQHANSAQFTNIFYSSSDEFPLLLLARCGNNSGATGYDECLFYRITRSNSTFTLTLVNSITIDFTTYGATWAIDNNNKNLYMTALENGTWQTTENNPNFFYVFNMPSETDILSGDAITLHKSDAIAAMSLSHMTTQAMYANGNLVYVGVSNEGQSVWCIDIFGNKVKSKIPLADTYEIEGVAIYNEKIYINQILGTDSTGINPMRIYELSF